MIFELVLRNVDYSLEFVFCLLLLQPFNFSPVSFACNFQYWGCVLLCEIDFLWTIFVRFLVYTHRGKCILKSEKCRFPQWFVCKI